LPLKKNLTPEIKFLRIKIPSQALTYHHGAYRDKYEAIYNLLGNSLPTYAQQMQEIEMIEGDGRMARYRIERVHNINGQPVTITYHIYFSKDRNGLWKIECHFSRI